MVNKLLFDMKRIDFDGGPNFDYRAIPLVKFRPTIKRGWATERERSSGLSGRLAPRLRATVRVVTGRLTGFLPWLYMFPLNDLLIQLHFWRLSQDWTSFLIADGMGFLVDWNNGIGIILVIIIIIKRRGNLGWSSLQYAIRDVVMQLSSSIKCGSR